MRNWVLKNGWFIIQNEKIKGTLYIQDGTILSFIAEGQTVHNHEIFKGHEYAELDCRGSVVGPGFIDLHVHGGGGADVMDASQDAFKQIAYTHGQKGTTRLLLTTVTADHHSLLQVCSAIKEWQEQLEDSKPQGALPLGIHLEGPYIAYSKKGAQNGAHIRPYSKEEFGDYQAASNHAIKLITLAPETLEDLGIIRELSNSGVVVSIGHTEADYDRVDQAVQHGAKHFTHLCNAMPSLHHRSPGPIAYALNHDGVSVEFIADGLHVHPAIMQLAIRAKQGKNIAIVTDAIRAMGMPDGSYDLGGLSVSVSENKATLEDGTLAGSCLDMEAAFQFLQQKLNLTEVELFQMMSTTPAAIIGLDKQLGTLDVGKLADLVLIKDGQVQAVMINGYWIKELQVNEA